MDFLKSAYGSSSDSGPSDCEDSDAPHAPPGVSYKPLGAFSVQTHTMVGWDGRPAAGTHLSAYGGTPLSNDVPACVVGPSLPAHQLGELGNDDLGNASNPATTSRPTHRTHPAADVESARGIGAVEYTDVDPRMFAEQTHTFHAKGYARDPASRKFVGNLAQVYASGGASVSEAQAAAGKRKREAKHVDDDDARAAGAGDDSGGRGFAVRPGGWMDRHLTLPAAEEKRKQDVAAAAADKNKTTLDASEVDAAAATAETETKDSKNVATFHGSSKQDYQGRSWHLCPRELTGRPDVSQSYPPKRWVRSYAGHSKGVSRIDLFPETGHLLLSASMDKTCKIWDVAKGRQLMTYAGHQQAVKDAAFSPDGSLFASVSFDKQIKVWDVERGTVVMEVSKASAVPKCVTWHPDQSCLLVGQSDNHVVQYELSTGDVVQEYDRHLGEVNAVFFLDGGKRFVSSSDDKSLRIWEFGVPIEVKTVADPSQHAAPACTREVHPGGKHVSFTSMDNKILTYEATDKFRRASKKTFAGHNVAGYACRPCYSPDGRHIASGDGDGKLNVWDWRNGRLVKTMRAHDKVTIDCAWHPKESSTILTASWDSLIKMWQ